MITRHILFLTPADFVANGFTVPTADEIDFKHINAFVSRNEIEGADLIVYITHDYSKILKCRASNAYGGVFPTSLGIYGLIPSLTDLLTDETNRA